MKKVLIFGNSGSGKSTLAQQLVTEQGLAHLDLDTLAWLPTTPPTRTPLPDAFAQINEFTTAHDAWIIEGCYGDLLEMLTEQANEMIYLSLDAKQCIKNAKSRPWEPHKYPTKAAQDANLDMLIGWIKDYETRADSTGKVAHDTLYNSFCKLKTKRIANQ